MLDYTKVKAQVVINKLPRGSADYDRKTMLLRLGVSPETINEATNGNDDIFIKTYANVQLSVQLLEYLPPALCPNIKGMAGAFLVLDKNNEVIILPASAIKLILNGMPIASDGTLKALGIPPVIEITVGTKGELIQEEAELLTPPKAYVVKENDSKHPGRPRKA
jgi:hypothetical protein